MNPGLLPLRDIHLPQQLPFWPLAIGWWILLVLIIFVIMVLIAYRWLRKTRHDKNLANQALQQILDDFSRDNDQQQLAQELSAWLRRVCLHYYPKSTFAGLTGVAWLEFLDKTTQLRFSDGIGRSLLTAPYQSNPDFDAAELINLCQQWLAALPRSPVISRPIAN